MTCVDPQAKDADLWMLIWEEMRSIHQEGVLLDAKAHLSKNEKQETTFLERCGGEMASIRASTDEQKREEACAALQFAAGFHCFGEWDDCVVCG